MNYFILITCVLSQYTGIIQLHRLALSKGSGVADTFIFFTTAVRR